MPSSHESAHERMLRLAKKSRPRKVDITYPRPQHSYEEMLEGLGLNPPDVGSDYEPLYALTMGPIIVEGRTLKILDGHHRYWRARNRGDDSIWVKVI